MVSEERTAAADASVGDGEDGEEGMNEGEDVVWFCVPCVSFPVQIGSRSPTRSRRQWRSCSSLWS